MLSGHKGAVLDLQWSRDSAVIYSASADATIASYDAGTGQRIRRHIGHDDVVNTLEVNKQGAEVLISGSDDGTIGVSQRKVFRESLCILMFVIVLGSCAKGGYRLH